MVPVDAEAYQIHKLGNDYLSSKRRFTKEDAININDLLENCKAVYAHNAEFDRNVLDHQFSLVDRRFLPW